MDLKDLSPLTDGQLLTRLAESLELATAPRTFLRRVGEEPPSNSALRIASLAACFTLFELALFGTIAEKPPEWNTLQFFGLCAVEISLGLFFVPCFYLVARYLKLPRPLSSSLNYALTFRFIFATPILFLFFLFLATEDYLFALLKGCAFWLYVVAFFLIYPLAAARHLRQRVVAVAICAILASGVMELGILAMTRFPHRRSIVLSMLEDPIGDEVDRVHLTWAQAGYTPPLSRLFDDFDDLIHAERDGSVLIGPPSLQAEADYVTAWRMRRPSLDSTWAREIKRLRREDSSAVFQTTHALLRENIAAIDTLRAAALTTSDFLTITHGPIQASQAQAFFDAFARAARVQSAAITRYLRYRQTRLELNAWWLLEYCGGSDSA